MDANEIDIINESEDKVIIYAPLDEIRIIEHILSNLETVRKELGRIAEGMKPVANYEL